MFRIAILVAMDKELGLLLNQMPDREEINIGENKYYAGRIGDKEVIAGKCGIGKVNSALNTYRLICDRKPAHWALAQCLSLTVWHIMTYGVDPARNMALQMVSRQYLPRIKR